MKLTEICYDGHDDHIITEELLYEMARVKPKDSGIRYIIFISTKEYTKQQHWARIKVSNIVGTFSSSDNFVVSVSKNPKVIAGTPKIKEDELNDIFDWIILNYAPLIKYWNDEYESDSEVYNDLKKI